MTSAEIEAATKVVLAESNMIEPSARAFAMRVLKAAEIQRVQFLQGLFGADRVSQPSCACLQPGGDPMGTCELCDPPDAH